ncbi:cytochrome P450 [Streptomyces cheonanensis]|uniref:Cytochrome P450 n=1 Tax=Streptomyces cheonanensis TaxID=312720 RepID=A0ABN2UT84_9ACTN
MDTSPTATVPGYPMPRAAGCPFDPPPAVEELRAAPLAKVRIWDGSTPWLITRHADQRALLNDPRVSIDDRRPGFPHVTAHRAGRAHSTPRMVTNTDAPDHTRLRRMVTGPFLVKRVEAMRPAVQGIVDRVIDDMLAGPRPADLLTALALPVPSLVICALLGVPYRDHAFFHHNSSRALDRSLPPAEAEAAGQALIGYLDRLLREKLADPADDTLSDLGARVTAGEMSHDEAVHMGVALLIAGHETTATMISLGTLALLRNPGRLAALRERSEDPKAVAGAVEELLRYLTIVDSALRRVALADIEIGGATIRAGDGLLFDLAAANRDPDAFTGDPAALDPGRPARHHQAFGYGPHQCLGQSLARLELQVVYGTLYRRIPTLRLAVPFEEIEFLPDGITYGVRALPVTW